MPDINFYFRQELAELAFQYTDMMLQLTYNEAFPAMGVVKEKGTFRVGDPRAWFLEPKALMSKFTTAKTQNFKDTPQNYWNEPLALGFDFSKGDLDSPDSFGFRTSQEMVQSRVMWQSSLLKKKKEKLLYTYASDNGNFQSSSYYSTVAAAWSTHATADTIADVAVARLQVPEINTMIIPFRTFLDLKQNVKLQALTGVRSEVRSTSDPNITPAWLATVYELDNVYVSKGSFITDSSDPTDQTKVDLWGNKALLFYRNPDSNDKDGRFMKHLFWDTGSASPDEGWIVTEKWEPDVGLVGLYTWQVGLYFQYLPHRKDLGYRLDGLY